MKGGDHLATQQLMERLGLKGQAAYAELINFAQMARVSERLLASRRLRQMAECFTHSTLMRDVLRGAADSLLEDR